MHIDDIKWVYATEAQIKIATDILKEKNSYKEFMTDYPFRKGANPTIPSVKQNIWDYYAANYPYSIHKDNAGGKWTLSDVDEQVTAHRLDVVMGNIGGGKPKPP